MGRVEKQRREVRKGKGRGVCVCVGGVTRENKWTTTGADHFLDARSPFLGCRDVKQVTRGK